MNIPSSVWGRLADADDLKANPISKADPKNGRTPTTIGDGLAGFR